MAKAISLDKYVRGEFAELLDIEMEKVSVNIADPNTDAKKVRSITLTITIKPDDKRLIGDVSVLANTKLAPRKAIETRMVFGYDPVEKRGEYSELNAEILGQVNLDEVEEMAQSNMEKRQENLIDYRKAE